MCASKVASAVSLEKPPHIISPISSFSHVEKSSLQIECQNFSLTDEIFFKIISKEIMRNSEVLISLMRKGDNRAKKFTILQFSEVVKDHSIYQ